MPVGRTWPPRPRLQLFHVLVRFTPGTAGAFILIVSLILFHPLAGAAYDACRAGCRSHLDHLPPFAPEVTSLCSLAAAGQVMSNRLALADRGCQPRWTPRAPLWPPLSRWLPPWPQPCQAGWWRRCSMVPGHYPLQHPEPDRQRRRRGQRRDGRCAPAGKRVAHVARYRHDQAASASPTTPPPGTGTATSRPARRTGPACRPR